MDFWTWLGDLFSPGMNLESTGTTLEIARWYWTQGVVVGFTFACFVILVIVPRVRMFLTQRR
jgi:hypothetical protein